MHLCWVYKMTPGILDPLIALIGSPNSGKTSVFNWLTNSHFKTVNYPGATVDCYLGPLAPHFGTGLRIMDTPGVYNLVARTSDEAVTMKALMDPDQNQQIRAVIVVVDATQLRRQLLLVEQVLRSGFQCVVALTMTDLLRKQNITVDIKKLSNLLNVPVISVEGRLGGGIHELVQAAKQTHRRSFEAGRAIVHVPTEEEGIELRRKASEIAEQVICAPANSGDLLAESLWWDSILLHWFWGPLCFLLIMATLFSSIFYLAAPLMDGVDLIFSLLSKDLSQLMKGNIWGEFVALGIVPSFAAVLVFVPQIFILFLGIGILEDTGYLARAATLIDRPLSRLGLSGRSFVPLLSGFACAVPAMMATRNITSAKERWIVLFILPLLTCSARLPVYALLLSFLFYGSKTWMAGLALALLYVGSAFVAGFGARLLSRILQKREPSTGHFVLELPIYRRPQWGFIARNAFYKTKTYARRAGPVIFVVALVLWVGSSFPRHPDGSAPSLSESYAAAVGQQVEPIFRPMGLDWRAGVGLLSAFSAREVFVSSLALVMNLSGDADGDLGLREGFLQRMREATFSDGTLVFTTASVAGLLVYFMLALQCASTTAMAAREWRSVRLAALQFLLFNSVAYAVAVSLVQGLRALGIQ